MRVLVANLGSTSFKFRLFDMELETLIARGSIDSIGATESGVLIEIGSNKQRLTCRVPDHANAMEMSLEIVEESGIHCMNDPGDFAIGFKAVVGGKFKTAVIVDQEVLAEMERLSFIAPAHNVPYAQAMRLFKQRFPSVPLVAAFETGFHAEIPAAYQTYAIPHEWTEKYGVCRSGFHGASHQYISERMRVLAGNCSRMISCHLGGSSSLCAIQNGISLGASMGLSPQSGLPQSNRCGDIDPYLVPLIMRETGMSMEEVFQVLATKSGLLGISGVSADLREILDASEQGHKRAQLAIDVYVAEIRRYLGGLMLRLNGLDALVFTGGIGERSSLIRNRVCESLQEFGIEIDNRLNDLATEEARIDSKGRRVQIWVVPTNEEIIVARQTVAVLETQQCS